jgi:hypothetical protein
MSTTDFSHFLLGSNQDFDHGSLAQAATGEDELPNLKLLYFAQFYFSAALPPVICY